MTKEQAIKLAQSGFWEQMSPREIAMFQLWEPLFCMPFDVFQDAVEKTLGRPVWTHEFAFVDKLRLELLDKRPAPTMEEILNLIPESHRVIFVV